MVFNQEVGGAQIDEVYGKVARFASDMSSPVGGEQIRAQVKWFNVEKGFGFVAPDDGSPDAFVHVSVLGRKGLTSLPEGATVVCTVGQGQRGRQVLEIMSVEGGSDEPPPARDPRPRGNSGAPGPQQTVYGTVKWFKPEKGFGFVVPDDADKDIFVHKSVLRNCGVNSLEPGQRVQMRVQMVQKGREATWIMPM